MSPDPVLGYKDEGRPFCRTGLPSRINSLHLAMACEQEHQRRSSQRNYDSLSPLAVLPNETLVNILFYALDETKTFDILVEADDYEAYKGFPLEGIDGEIIFWRVRKETCLSTVCRLWKELFEKKYVVGYSLFSY